jgi:hypothetical protein
MKVHVRLESVARYVAVLAISASLTATAMAQTVLIDFGGDNSFRGVDAPSPDPNGNFWNTITPGAFFADLRDTGNNATTIDFGFSTAVGTDSFNGPAGVTSFPDPTPAEIAATDIDTAALGILGVKEAAIDFAAGPDTADNRVRFEIQQLDPTKTYNLTFFGSHKFSTDDATAYSIYTDNTYTTLVDSASLNHQTPGSPNLHNRDQVATLSGIAPQASNILYVQFVGSNGSLGYLNSMSVTAVPEPGALAIFASVLGLVVGVRRRK